MKNKIKIISISALFVVFGLVSFTTFVYGAEHQLYSASGFVNLLISKGIISEAKVEKAKELLGILEKSEQAPATIVPDDTVEVTVSQYIQHSDLTYGRFENIEGLLLTVKNTSEKAQTLTAKRGCQVVYRIYDNTNTLVYNYADEDVCHTQDRVSYVLEAGKTRIFPVIHDVNTHPLSVGTYTFEIEYPEYGRGKKKVTIQ